MNVVLFASALVAAICAAQMQTRPQADPQSPSRMEIVLEKRDGDKPKIIDPGHIFSDGDLVRFRFKTNFTGYLYVMNRSTSGKYTLLFPKDDTGRDNRIERLTEYLLPATPDGWFRIQGPAGYEVVYWVMSPADLSPSGGVQIPYIHPLPEPLPSELPPGVTPRCDDTVFRARGDCVDISAGAKPVGKGETLPQNLAQVTGGTDRDLVFMRKQNLSMVSSPAPLGGPVIYEFHLAHK